MKLVEWLGRNTQRNQNKEIEFATTDTERLWFKMSVYT